MGLLEGVDINSGFNISMTIVMWSLVVGLLIGLVWFIWWILSFKHRVTIFEPMGDAYEYITDKKEYVKIINKKGVEKDNFNTDNLKIKITPTFDTFHKAKIIKQSGTYSLKLLYPNKKLMLPKNVFQALTKKGKKSIKLVKLNEHTYMPVFLADSDTGKLKYFEDEGFFDWFVTDMERDYKKFIQAGFFEKWGFVVFPLIGFIIGFIIIIGVMKMAGGMTENMTDAAKTIASSLTSTAESLKDAITKQIID